jgi:hypothetical protein
MMSTQYAASWPSGGRDTTEWPQVRVSVEADFRKHLEELMKLDGAGWNDFNMMNQLTGSSRSPERWRTYRVMYQRLGLIRESQGKVALSALGKSLRDLPGSFEVAGRKVEDELALKAARVLVRYQLNNPLDSFSCLPPGCDVRPYYLIWKAALELGNKLHYQELNRVLLRLMTMGDLPGAIDQIRNARKQLGDLYSSAKEPQLALLLGDETNPDQASARMATWFSNAGWGGLLIASDSDADGFRKITNIGEKILPAVLAEPLPQFTGTTAEDWTSFYLAPLDQLSGININSGAKNIIFYGPPGTGKSSLAEKTAQGSDSSIFRTLFHPEFSYADFIGSFRPVIGFDSLLKIKDRGGNEINKPISYFQFVPGVLALALREAFAKPAKKIVLILDEINRGDCAAIFGDFFQLLDRDPTGKSKYGINADSELTSYLGGQGDGTKVNWNIESDNMLYFPPNFSLYATMNTSDQSLYAMDAAFKRRWNWQPCHVEYDELIQKYGSDLRLIGDVTKEEYDWVELLKSINKKITARRMEEKQVGPWFLVPDLSGKIHMNEFGNKVLFYLWHDVFKDEHGAQEFPFRDDQEFVTFAKVQEVLNQKGLRHVFKEEILGKKEVPPIKA